MQTQCDNSAASPFFSVVTVVMNDQPGLERTHDSVVPQTERDFEWLVVDGMSRDDTREYVQSLRLPCLRWVSEKDQGIYDAMNKGARMARGRYVIFMNGGDVFHNPSCLTEVRRVIEEAGCPELCFAGCNYRFGNGRLIYRAPRKMGKAIKHGLPAMHQATLYRRDFFDNPAYSLSYPVSADYFIAASFFMRGARACYLDRPVAGFEVGGNSTMKTKLSRREAWQIQRDVLKLGLLPRASSYCRRFFAHGLLLTMHLFTTLTKR